MVLIKEESLTKYQQVAVDIFELKEIKPKNLIDKCKKILQQKDFWGLMDLFQELNKVFLRDVMKEQQDLFCFADGFSLDGKNDKEKKEEYQKALIAILQRIQGYKQGAFLSPSKIVLFFDDGSEWGDKEAQTLFTEDLKKQFEKDFELDLEFSMNSKNYIVIQWADLFAGLQSMTLHLTEINPSWEENSSAYRTLQRKVKNLVEQPPQKGDLFNDSQELWDALLAPHLEKMTDDLKAQDPEIDQKNPNLAINTPIAQLLFIALFKDILKHGFNLSENKGKLISLYHKENLMGVYFYYFLDHQLNKYSYSKKNSRKEKSFSAKK